MAIDIITFLVYGIALYISERISRGNPRLFFPRDALRVIGFGGALGVVYDLDHIVACFQTSFPFSYDDIPNCGRTAHHSGVIVSGLVIILALSLLCGLFVVGRSLERKNK